MESQRLPPTVWGRFRLDWGRRTWIMGIINVTPDSFSGDGLTGTGTPAEWAERAAAQARQMVADGAHLIDVGGASSRPRAPAIPLAVELERVVPAVRVLGAALPEVPISVDTTRAEVARAAIAAGAALINDVSGLHAEPDLAAVAAQAGVPIAIVANMRGVQRYDLFADITRLLAEGMATALAAGVPWEHIILDPGFGFGLTPSENIALVRHLERFTVLGRPLLLGTSRKATLGTLLGGAPPEERVEASLASAVAGILHGVDIVRVHDVRATARAARLADAIARGMPGEP
jgi:dihydropteroate synthase